MEEMGRFHGREWFDRLLVIILFALGILTIPVMFAEMCAPRMVRIEIAAAVGALVIGIFLWGVGWIPLWVPFLPVILLYCGLWLSGATLIVLTQRAPFS